jgi:DNA-binding CsgD family transcriptional regulator
MSKRTLMQADCPAIPITTKRKITEKINEIRKFENDIPVILAVINLRDQSVVYLSEMGRKLMGITLKELRKMGNDEFLRIVKSSDAADYLSGKGGILQSDSTLSLFHEISLAAGQEKILALSSIKIILQDENSLPLLALVTAIPINNESRNYELAYKNFHERKFLSLNRALIGLLSKREREVLKLLALGYSNQNIASALFISVETAATHRKKIKKKLNVRSRCDFAMYAQLQNSD